jgi:glyoxylase-like metal-dependent hydrolase (beta-lactamase superfamily II)
MCFRASLEGELSGEEPVGRLGRLSVPRKLSSFAVHTSKEIVMDISFGEVSVARVVEYFGDGGAAPEEITPGLPREVWDSNRSWLVPDFLSADSSRFVAAGQTWVLRSEGKTILVDTGTGNGKERALPHFSMWETNFLANLAAAGVQPEDVDIVINTHLHLDHVGWNTYDHNGEWVTTFPNATYLMSKTDFDYWNPDNGNVSVVLGPVNNVVFEDSVRPVYRDGRVTLWEDSYVIDSNLRLELAPGHTPGSAVVKLQSGSDRVVFAADTLHVPLQILEPDYSSCFCEDPAAATVTRHKVLGWAADNNVLVLPSHLGGPGGVEVIRDGSKFAIKQWAPFEKI